VTLDVLQKFEVKGVRGQGHRVT